MNKENQETGKVITQGVVSRRNQDGTVILMKLDESNLFFKIDGIAAATWGEYENPVTLNALIEKYSAVYTENQDQLTRDLTAFHQELSRRGLIVSTTGAQTLQKTTGTPSPLKKVTPYCFGSIKEFNLEQIETEVLSESLYLDVFAGSDLRLKKDITPIANALDQVLQLDGVHFEWKNADAPQGLQAGLIAQQVAAAMPELVRKDSESGMLAVNYPKMTSYLVEAIKTLNTQVRTLEDRIKELECN
ncbi:MAG TPA: hypothetical protein DCS07_15365 [Bdellovibrionales bacterium]|nr:MAG: hypothetical protein A2Z97_03275 [Bdellovibrionales bacterium GWB1_52_6]OFZ02894.1 MAG: hypothetical protein A2X97_04800 [Bdellovibrionales bacterium GWA1_52_35]OFZ44022.1 MAG: hypothetical protein A2070_06465 [Bdellovibrionales bacterium GWC1_52_8]HAR43989.1 hypothetical protein [Bdellovibrionales bacterium]HCM38477.1 hypothetical protein [Bdellovibrionales bacterium]